MYRTQLHLRIFSIERLGSLVNSDLTLMSMNVLQKEVTTEAMNFSSTLSDDILIGKGLGPIERKSLNRTQQNMQTQRHMTNVHEALVMANEARKVTTATNAMSSPKVANASTGANASTRMTLVPVAAPLAVVVAFA